MTRGIYLGNLLICFLLALHVCCSWAAHEGSWSHSTNPIVPFWHSQDSDKGSRPQDGFRQANTVKDRSTNTKARLEPYSLDKYYLISQTNPRRQSLYGSIGYVLPKKVGQSGGSVSDFSNQYNGVFRTLPGQRGTERIDQYAPSKPDLNSLKTSSHQPLVWKPQNSKVQQKPGLDTKLNGKRGFKPPREFMSPTSGLSRGSKKMYQKGVSKHATSNSHTNPVLSNVHQQYELPISHYLSLSQSYPASAYNLGDISAEVHHIPREYGGHPIERPGDEELVEQIPTTKKPKKPLTRRPPTTYTLPARPTEAYRTRPKKPHMKSNWIKVLSYKLRETHGEPVRTL